MGVDIPFHFAKLWELMVFTVNANGFLVKVDLALIYILAGVDTATFITQRWSERWIRTVGQFGIFFIPFLASKIDKDNYNADGGDNSFHVVQLIIRD